MTTYPFNMCVLFLHYHPSSSSPSFSASVGGGQCTCPYVLVAANNRDEFYERATAPLDFWGEDNSILGGDDGVLYSLSDFNSAIVVY